MSYAVTASHDHCRQSFSKLLLVDRHQISRICSSCLVPYVSYLIDRTLSPVITVSVHVDAAAMVTGLHNTTHTKYPKDTTPKSNEELQRFRYEQTKVVLCLLKMQQHYSTDYSEAEMSWGSWIQKVTSYDLLKIEDIYILMIFTI